MKWMLLVATLSAPLCGATVALAASGIYTCVDDHGRKLTSDRPIQECLDREQRLLNKDGSHRQTMLPRMSAEESAAYDELQRQKAAQELARKDAIRRDRNLMLRYPNQAAHNKAREAALDDLRKAVKVSEARAVELQADHKDLQSEAEFFKGKPLPFKLRSRVEANEATQQAQRDIIQNQKDEMVRINALYDAELARLTRLWAGAPPGSVPDVAAASAPATPAVVSRPASSSKAR
ncbi:MAG: DUF4124 domain-containing protein [Burkholderiales bacterium]|nr:DUF4124 domain-containing protein [Burkholderiales bacterium]